MAKHQFALINSVLIFVFVFIRKCQSFDYEVSQRCQNPNGRLGQCISIYECPSILGIIRSRWTPGYAFARKSECAYGKGRRPHVCCTGDTGFVERNQLKDQRIIFPDDVGYTPITPRAPPEKRQIFDLFPKPPDCGPISVVNKIFGGEEAELGEFPWLANLEYQRPNGALVSVCSGNVINQRYVLTAGHCVKGKIEEKIGKLVSLRVGDHNTESAIDCNNMGCIDPFQRLYVESLIVHPYFNTSSKIYNRHDIALIRTERNIIFSDTVAPVCLPEAEYSLPALRTGMRLTVAGWGHNGTVKFTAEKRKVDVPYVENRDCSYNVAEEQLCAGGEFRKDSCTGDSGGSLAHLTFGGWFIEGIVSYGRGCGLESPAIYTRVRSYIQWIHDNVQA